MDAITEHLVKNLRFTKSTGRDTIPGGEFNPLASCTCYVRVHEFIYFVWYENLRHFGLVKKSERPKGLAGGGKREFEEILLPRPFYDLEDAKKLIDSMLGIN